MPNLRIQVIGWDHHQCELALRERLSIAYGELPDCLTQLGEQPGVEESVIVSTCNRSEWYVAGDIPKSDLIAFVAQYVGIKIEEITSLAYFYAGREALKHLFRVVSSLESMVIGEYQIVHQVRQAYERSQQCRSVGPLLHGPFQRALSVGKMIRTETAIGKYKVSIASVAVDLAQHIIGDLTQSRLLIIGAGEMADLTLTHLLEKGVQQISIINRRQERAEQIIREHEGLRSLAIKPSILEWKDLSDALSHHDIVMCSTAAPVPVITVDKIKRGRRAKPIMFIDLAMPRDVAEDVAQLDNVYAYNLDNFDQVVARHQQLRQEDIQEADDKIEQAVEQYSLERKQSTLLTQVSGYFDELTDDEFVFAKKYIEKNEAQIPDDVLRYVLSRVAKKMRHQLIQLLRDHPDNASMRELIARICDQPGK